MTAQRSNKAPMRVENLRSVRDIHIRMSSSQLKYCLFVCPFGLFGGDVKEIYIQEGCNCPMRTCSSSFSLSRARFQLYVLLCCRISENNDLAHSARSGRVIS